jgi:cytochrome c biogenesis protein CcmG, thiol:disulfide interchange protein DsbE
MKNLFHIQLFLVLSILLLSPPAAHAGDPGSGEPAEKPPIIKVGEKAPSFALKTLNEKQCGMPSVSFKSMIGSMATDKKVKALLLTFASVHCKPCMKELPELHKYYLEAKEQGIGILVIDMDREEEELAQVRKLAEEKKFTFPVLSDRFNLLARRYKANELPYMVLVGPKGKVRWVKVGYEESAMDELKKAVELLINVPKEGKEDS